MSSVLVDMDGVLCDFKKAVKQGLLESINSTEESYPQSRIGFFCYLEPMPNSIEAMSILRKYHDVYICTRPSFPNLNCYTEKAIWIRKHLGYDMQKKLFLAPDKSMVLADFLIDDSLKDGQDKFKGELIQFGTTQYPDWQSVLQRFGLSL